ncbi:MAG TPA: DUF4416 family protein [Candidatus Binatia bacterium]|jgi:uncharacterized protein DUF4416|nr:DUF4416 family protein [Candidatus Binatia bacterium]
MGTAREPKPAKYFVALLSSDVDLLTAVETDLSPILSEIDARSEVVPWIASKFYEREMGRGLLRRFVSFSVLQSPENLAEIKLQTQRIEDNYRIVAAGRRVNLDPGYIDAFKLVLASTKNAGQRIYLRSGIYGEATLLYHDAAFHGLEYSYRDYLWPESLAFFTQMRAQYLTQLRKLE